jgi:hypothetical protein
MAERDIGERTRQALADPRPGDRFHEMYSWWTVVVAVSDWGVTVLQAGGPFNLVPGRVRNDETPQHREERIKRREPYQEWVPVEPWQERAEARCFATLAEFQMHMRGEMLADRGLDISEWARCRAALGKAETDGTP